MIGLATGRNDLGIDAVCPVNWLHPLNRDLASWWLVLPGRSGGTIWGDLTNRYPGTLTNMAPPTDWVGPQGRPGGFGALRFVAGTGSRTIAAITGPATDSITISAWVKPASIASYYGIVSRASFGVAILTSGATGNPLTFRCGGGAEEFNAATGLTWTLGEWHFVAAAISSGGVLLTMGNATTGWRTYTDANANTVQNIQDSWFVGRESSNARTWNGLIDDARIWRRALSASEVQAVYRESLRGYPETLRRVRMPRAYAASGGAGGADTSRNLLLLGVG